MKTEEDVFDSIYLLLKLVNGDTLIATILTDTEKSVMIKDPYQINSVTKEAGSGTLLKASFYHEWFLGAKAGVSTIRKEHIISAAIPDDKTKLEYTNLVKGATKPKESAPEVKKPKPDWSGLDFKLPKDQDRFKN